MQNPNNLRVTALARSLAVDVYRASASFPASERFGLTAQMRRAAVSVGSNITEGCGRSGDRELAHFLHVALGSASELEFQAVLAVELELLPVATGNELAAKLGDVKRMLAGLIKALRKRAKPSGGPR
jgi:four helix bundle protein